MELTRIVEALLLGSDSPLSFEKLQNFFDEGQRPNRVQLQEAIDELKTDYKQRSFELADVAGGYLIQTKSEYSRWIAKLHIEKPMKYSRALLETLSIIAYKQPVTRGDIEEIRGVAVSTLIMKTLLEREWIRIAGHKDVPGKPAVYVTTKEFLNYFNLRHLNELPLLPDIAELLTVQPD